MPKRVLDVGNCGFDHSTISQAIRLHFDAEVVAARGRHDALDALSRENYDLVLVNRKTADFGDGIELIRQIKTDERLKGIPVMLLSNYPEYQAQAVAAGAEPGFGKGELHQPGVQEKLRPFLA